jgi:hypothetical protein
MLFAYIAPETTLPLASTLVATAGVVMMFGQSAIRQLRKRLTSATIVLSRSKASLVRQSSSVSNSG